MKYSDDPKMNDKDDVEDKDEHEVQRTPVNRETSEDEVLRNRDRDIIKVNKNLGETAEDDAKASVSGGSYDRVKPWEKMAPFPGIDTAKTPADKVNELERHGFDVHKAEEKK